MPPFRHLLSSARAWTGGVVAGAGIQFRAPVGLGVLLLRGILREV